MDLVLNLMDENRSEESDVPDDSDSDPTSSPHQSDESEVSDESNVSSPLASTVMNDSSGPDSDDPASDPEDDPEEESLASLSSDEAGGNGTVLDIDSDEDTLGSDDDIQDRLVARKKKAVRLHHSAHNQHALTACIKGPGQEG